MSVQPDQFRKCQFEEFQPGDVREFASLGVLNLRGNTGITEVGLRRLEKIPHLHILNLRRASVTQQIELQAHQDAFQSLKNR